MTTSPRLSRRKMTNDIFWRRVGRSLRPALENEPQHFASSVGHRKNSVMESAAIPLFRNWLFPSLRGMAVGLPVGTRDRPFQEFSGAGSLYDRNKLDAASPTPHLLRPHHVVFSIV